MSIKKCPHCGIPVANYSVCPMCGKRVEDNDAQSAEGKTVNSKNLIDKCILRVGNIKFGIWDLLFILICNLSFILVLINVLIGGKGWCQYPVFGLFSGYFIAFACGAGNIRRFLTRYRNAVVFLNFVAGIFDIVYRFIDSTAMGWAFDYFIPVNLISACIVILFLLLHPNISVRSVLFSLIILLVQSIIQLILRLCGVTAHEHIPCILVTIAFGVNLLSVINLVFIYFIKYRNCVEETFRFWE